MTFKENLYTPSTQIREHFENFMYARNAQLLAEGLDSNSKYWVNNTHYATWLAAQDYYCYQFEPYKDDSL